MEAGVVPPSHVLECCQLDLLDRFPWVMSVDRFGLVEPVHRLGEGIVIRVTDGSRRGFRIELDDPVRVHNREVVRPVICVMDRLVEWSLSVEGCHVQCV